MDSASKAKVPWASDRPTAVERNFRRSRYVYRAHDTFIDQRTLRHLPIYGLLAITSLLCEGRVQAQPDELTGEFGKLSAKERARIAQREETEAGADVVFTELMAGAEELFKAQDYDGALQKYKEARTRRPYNVHPKVKIEDLQALIKRREEEKATAIQEPPPSEPAPVTRTTDHAEAPAGPGNDGPPPTLLTDPPPMPPPKEEPLKERTVEHAPREKQPDPVTRPDPVVVQPAPQLEEGERVYKEGRSIVVETTVNEEDRLVVYRKVSHPWGEEHYFREGSTISERAYRSALGR